MRVVIPTSDKYLWFLRPTAYLLKRHWPAQRADVFGFSRPDYEMPNNCTFTSLGAFSDYPVDRWSDAVIKMLTCVSDELVIWMMEDYWLLRDADIPGIRMLGVWMLDHPDVARMDLTLDRALSGHARTAGTCAHLDLIECGPQAPYQFSFQSAIWRREYLLACLAPGESPWRAEIAGAGRLQASGGRVFGTRQGPLRYLIGVQQGRLALDGGYQGQEYAMPAATQAELIKLGFLPGGR